MIRVYKFGTIQSLAPLNNSTQSPKIRIIKDNYGIENYSGNTKITIATLTKHF